MQFVMHYSLVFRVRHLLPISPDLVESASPVAHDMRHEPRSCFVVTLRYGAGHQADSAYSPSLKATSVMRFSVPA